MSSIETIDETNDDLFTVESTGIPAYARIPRWLCTSSVSDRGYRLFGYLTQFENLPVGIVCSHRRIATDLHWSIDKVKDAQSDLIAIKALTVKQRSISSGGGQTTNQYFLHYLPPDSPPEDSNGQSAPTISSKYTSTVKSVSAPSLISDPPQGSQAPPPGPTSPTIRDTVKSHDNHNEVQCNEHVAMLAPSELDYPGQPCPPDNYVTTLTTWAANKNYRTPTIIDDPLPLYRFAMDVLDTEADKKNALGKQRYLLCALQVINDFWEEMYGERPSPVQIRHFRAGIALRGGACVLDALAKASEWGAGLTNGYENDPLAVMKYALGIIRKGDAEARR